MTDFVPPFEQREGDARSFGPARLPTLGAIPVVNEKGKVVMQKVKVQRYVAGKIPAYAEYPSSDEEDDKRRERRERREKERTTHDADDYSHSRHSSHRRHDREIAAPEVLEATQSIKPEPEDEDEREAAERRERARLRCLQVHSSPTLGSPQVEQSALDDDESENEEDDEELQRRRDLLRQKAMRREIEQMKLEREIKQEIKEEVEEEEEEDDDDESGSDSSDEEEEDEILRLKPIFVRKRDRITLTDVESEKQKLAEQELAEQKQKEERKQESIRIAEQIRKEEDEMEKRRKEENTDYLSVVTDDENEELAYEAWKLREMKRLKRNREEREALAQEKAELDRIHSMTEEERKAWARANPKFITNQQNKGKYKFLQKYFHRGAFFLDEEDEVKKRDFAQPTLEDQFDKSILPKVMQVKDFGKASRTKWTHLTAEDTTDHQGAWNTPNAQNVAFFNKKAGGARAVFDRPAAKRRKND